MKSAPAETKQTKKQAGSVKPAIPVAKTIKSQPNRSPEKQSVSTKSSQNKKTNGSQDKKSKPPTPPKPAGNVKSGATKPAVPKETAQAARLRREAALAAVINNEPRAEISDPGENAPRQQPESGGRGAGSPAVPAPEATKEPSKADKAAAALESATAEKEAADVQYASLVAAADVAKQEYHEAAAKAHIAALDHDTGKATHDDVVNSSRGIGSTSDAESQENATDDQTAIELHDLHRLAAAERVGLAQQRVEAADAAFKKAMKKYNKAVKSADPVDEIGQDDDNDDEGEVY